MTCKNLGPLHAKGDHPDVYYCEGGKTFCTLQQSTMKLLDGSPMSSCSEQCSGFVPLRYGDATNLDDDGGYLTCGYRGVVIDSLNLSNCSCDPRIFECGKHEKCIKRIPIGKTRAHFGQRLNGVTACRDCEDWKNARIGNIGGFVSTVETIPAIRKPRLVITIATGEKYLEMLAVSGPLMQAYADKCDADFVALTNRTQTWGLYEKYRLLQWGQAYEHMLFIDVDCIVKPWCCDLFKLVPLGHGAMHDDTPINKNTTWLKQSWDRIMESQGISRELDEPHVTWNTGVVMCDRATSHMWAPPPKPLPGSHEDEQIWVQSTIQDRRIPMVGLDRKFNEQWYAQNTEPGSDAKKWAMRAEDAEIIHFALCEQRLTEMKRWAERIKATQESGSNL